MSEEISVEEGTGHSVSRRTLLKGAAVVGGAVWVAPVIESFASKAAAASAIPNYSYGTFSCSYALLVYTDASGNYWAVKYTQENGLGGTCASLDTDGGAGGGNILPWTCGTNTFAINSNNKITITPNGGTTTVIPDGDCSNFYSSGTTITFEGTSGGTWVTALIHNGTSYKSYCSPSSPTTFTC